MRKVFGESFLSRYFHQKISAIFKVKLCYFWYKLSVFQHHWILIFYKCTRSCFVTSFQFTVDFCFHLLWYTWWTLTQHSTVNSFSVIISTSLAFSSKFSRPSMLVHFISKPKFILEARIRVKKLLHSNIEFESYDVFHTSIITVMTDFLL